MEAIRGRVLVRDAFQPAGVQNVSSTLSLFRRGQRIQARVVVSFESGTGVPPVNGHGQDGRATPNDTTTQEARLDAAYETRRSQNCILQNSAAGMLQPVED